MIAWIWWVEINFLLAPKKKRLYFSLLRQYPEIHLTLIGKQKSKLKLQATASHTIWLYVFLKKINYYYFIVALTLIHMIMFLSWQKNYLKIKSLEKNLARNEWLHLLKIKILQTHHVDSTLKLFPRRFNVESTWCVRKVLI